MVEGKYVGSIEAGGTKFILAVQDTESGEVVAKKRIPTTDAKETLAKSVDFLKNIQYLLQESELLVQLISIQIQEHLVTSQIRLSVAGLEQMLKVLLKKNWVFQL